MPVTIKRRGAEHTEEQDRWRNSSCKVFTYHGIVVDFPDPGWPRIRQMRLAESTWRISSQVSLLGTDSQFITKTHSVGGEHQWYWPIYDQKICNESIARQRWQWWTLKKMSAKAATHTLTEIHQETKCDWAKWPKRTSNKSRQTKDKTSLETNSTPAKERTTN